MAYIGSAPTTTASSKSQTTYRYLCTAGQSVISGADLNNNTLSCDPLDTEVFMNGLKLDSTDTTITATQVSLVSAAAAGDEIEVVAYRTFESADHYTKSVADSRYYTQTDADTRYVNVAGDTMTGDLTTTGNVGIGVSPTTSYGRVLQVHDTGTSGANLRLTDSNSAAGTGNGMELIHINADSYVINREAGALYHIVGAAGNTAQKMDDDGIVTMPNQPSMSGRAIRPNPTGGYVTKNVNVYLDDLTHNIGNHWNNSTGVWTCPVAGRYWVFAAFLIDNDLSAGSLARYGWRRNGTEFFVGYENDKYGSAYGGTLTSGGIFNCAANDTITLQATHGAFHTGAESNMTICLLS